MSSVVTDPAAASEPGVGVKTSSPIGASVWGRLAVAVGFNALVWLAVGWALDWFGVISW